MLDPRPDPERTRLPDVGVVVLVACQTTGVALKGAKLMSKLSPRDRKAYGTQCHTAFCKAGVFKLGGALP